MANTDTKVITGVVRLSYAHIWEPAAVGDGDEKKYSASLIIPKSDKKTIQKIKTAQEAAIAAGISTKFEGKRPPKLKLPLRDGDEERDDDAYKNSYFVNATSKTQPGIVDRSRQEILDSTEVYSGCYVIASLNFYAFNTKGNKGIACGLNNIMFVKDGDPLGGRSRAEDDFAEIDLGDEYDDDDDFMN